MSCVELYEVTVLDEVLAHLSVLHAPLRLQCQVGDAHGVHGHAVTVDEDALVGRHGVAVGVVESVGVVERAAVGRIGDGLVAVIRGGSIEQSERLVADVAVKSGLGGRHGKGVERAAAHGSLGLHLDGVAVVAGIESVERLLGVRAARIGRVGRDVLHLQGRARGSDVHIGAQIAAAQDDLARVVGQRGNVLHGHGAVALQGSGRYLKATGGRHGDVASRQVLCRHVEGGGGACAIERQAVS